MQIKSNNCEEARNDPIITDLNSEMKAALSVHSVHTSL